MSQAVQNQAAQKRAVQDIYPLSPTQRGLLFHSLYESDSAGNYIVQVSYTLQGYLDRRAFEAAWQQLVDRHSILRTAFVWERLEAPVQVVGHQALLPVNWQNWAHLSEDEQQGKFEDLLSSDRTRGFHLSKAPLMRVIAVQLSKNKYRILWTHHHILLDGWSLPILFKEWISLYKAACLQESALSDAPLPTLSKPRPYKDYIAWLQKQDLAAAKQFWAKQLAGITAPTPLSISDGNSYETPSINERESAQSFHAEYLTLSEMLSQQLKQFSQQQRITLSTLVQGAWAKLLSVYSGESAVLYGLARAGRPGSLQDADSRVGLFINTLPMKAEISSACSTVDLLQQIQSQQLAQQPYEYTPLVEVQAVSEIPRQQSLFESVIVFENYPLAPAKDLAGLDLVEISITEQTHYPLTLFAVATEAVEFKLIYDTQRFSPATVTRILTHLHTALTEMCTHPQRSIDNLSILSDKERHQLLEFGLGPAVKAAQVSVQDAIAHQATLTPQATALIFEGTSLTYAQLNNQANQLSRFLQQRVTSGQLIGLCVERSVDMIVSLLAILKAGCAYVPLDPGYPVARLRETLENAGVCQVICHGSTEHIFAEAAFAQRHPFEILNLDEHRAAIAAQPMSTPAITSQPDALAYLIYTSGSTGQPKGVPITQQNLSNLLSSMASRLHIQPSDTLMAVTTLAFDIAALELFLPLISGAKLLLTSQEATRNSHQLIAYLDTSGVDIMQATPATWRLLLGSGWAGQTRLRILCGGEALEVDLARRLLNCAEEVWNVYGPTETTIWSSALELSTEMLTKGTVPIGGPIDNTQFHVLDPHQQPVPIGVAGELYIGGAGVSPGYWQQADLTAERFLEVRSVNDECGIHHSSRLYRTGDRVRYRADGLLDYLGRLDYQTKLRGYRIELGEIEAALLSHPVVTQAVVLISGKTDADKYLAAYVTLATMTDRLSPSELRSHLTARLPYYMVPATYQVLQDFPLTPNGKIDRLALAKMTPSQIVDAAQNRPKTPVETALTAIWKSLLPQESISIHDNFFEIGGHSLLLVNAQGQIKEQLGKEISLVDLFHYPTLSSLAGYIAQQPESDDGASATATSNQSQARTAAIDHGKRRLKQRLKQKKADLSDKNQTSDKKLGGVSS